MLAVVALILRAHARARGDGGGRRGLHAGRARASRRCSRSSRTCRCSRAATTRAWRCCICSAWRCWRGGGWTSCVERGVRGACWPSRAALLAFPVLYTIAALAARRGICVGDALAVTFGFDARAGAADPTVGRGDPRRGDAAVDGGRGRRAARAAAPLRRRGWRCGALVLVAFADLAWAGVGYNPAIDRAAGRPAADAGDPRAAGAPRPARFVTVGDIPENAIPMDYKIARGARLRPAGRGALRPAVAHQALARVPVAGRPAARVHPARAAQGRRRSACAALASSASAACSCSRATDPLLRAEGCGWSMPARTRGSTPTTPRCRGRSWSARERRVGRRATPQITARGFDAAARGGRRGRASRRGRPGSPGRPRSCTPRTTAQRRRDAHRPGPGCSSSPTRGRRAGTPSWAGRSSKVERVDYLYRGVRVPAGTHIVEFTYRPLSWRIGWIVSLAGASSRWSAGCCGGRQVKRAAARARRRAGDRRAAACSSSTPSASGRAGRARTRRSGRGWAGWTSASTIFFLLSGYPALRPVPARAGAARRVRVAAGAADRARLLGGADGRGDRAAAARGVANVPLFYGFAQVYRGIDRPVRDWGRRGRCASRCSFYAFLPLWALLIARIALAVAAGGAVRRERRVQRARAQHVRREGRAAGPRADRAPGLPGLVRAGDGASRCWRRAACASAAVGRGRWAAAALLFVAVGARCCGTRGWTPTRTRNGSSATSPTRRSRSACSPPGVRGLAGAALAAARCALGEISYGIYLYHLLVLALLSRWGLIAWERRAPVRALDARSRFAGSVLLADAQLASGGASAVAEPRGGAAPARPA